jgi:BlaI family transcriptional regulator, penicillinase repressor
LTRLPPIQPVTTAGLTERKLTAFELRLMDALWARGPCSVREIHEAFPDQDRPAYTTVQTMVYRLEAKGAVRRVKKIGNAFIFEATVSRHSMARRLVDDLLAFFGGRSVPVVAHLIEAGRLTAEDVQAAEQLLRQFRKQQGR